MKGSEFVLYLRTQYFVASPEQQLSDPGARFYYFLGLRAKVSRSRARKGVKSLNADPKFSI